jgi:hypothetical protein
MAVFAPPKRRPALTRLDEELLARLLQQAQTPIEAYTRESALGVPWGSLANSLVGGMLARGQRKKAENIEERRNEAMSKLLKLEKLPEAPVGSEEFVGGAYMRDGGDIVTNLAPVEDKTYGRNLGASQQLGTVLRGTDGPQPNYIDRVFGGALPEKTILNRNQLISEAGFEPMEYNLYEQQVEAARPKPTAGEVEIFYDKEGKEFEGQTVVFPDGSVKVKQPEESIESANFYNWDDITRTPPKEKDIQLITDSTTNEIIAIDKNNIDGGYITVREGKVPQNIKQFGNAVVDTNQIGEDGQFKVLFNIPEDVKVNIQTFNMPNGITRTVARDELTGKILWQEEIEQETIKITQNGEILSMVGNKFTQLRAPEEKDKQTITTPEGTFIWNAKDGTIGEKLFDKEPNITWKEVFDPELNKNMLYGIKDDGSVPYKFDAKKEELKKSAREIKIKDYMDLYNIERKKAVALIDKQVDIIQDGNLTWVIDKTESPPKKVLLDSWTGGATVNEDLLDNDINLTQINKEDKKGWYVPRLDLVPYASSSMLQQSNRLSTTALRGMEDIAELHKIIENNPQYIGMLGQIVRVAQGTAGYGGPLGRTIENVARIAGVNLNDPNIQKVMRLTDNIQGAANDIFSFKGWRQPSIGQVRDIEDKFDWHGLFTTGQSILPRLKAEFENMNKKYMILQSMNPENTEIIDYTLNPAFSHITGNTNTQNNVTIIKNFNADGTFTIIEEEK